MGEGVYSDVAGGCGGWKRHLHTVTNTSPRGFMHQTCFSFLFLWLHWGQTPRFPLYSPTVFFKHQQDAGGSEVKTCFMFECKLYFQTNRSWLSVKKHSALLCRAKNSCHSIRFHDLICKLKRITCFAMVQYAGHVDKKQLAFSAHRKKKPWWSFLFYL